MNCVCCSRPVAQIEVTGGLSDQQKQMIGYFCSVCILRECTTSHKEAS